MHSLAPESLTIRPQPGPQEAFLSTPADIAIYGGSAGAGKTFSLLLEPIRHHDNSKFGAVIFRRTYPQIMNEGGLWDESQELYRALRATPKLGDLTWEFPSRAKLKFSHLQYDMDVYAWQGSQICLLGFDELTHFTEFQFFYMLSRNRSMCGVRPYVRATCNPVPVDDPVGGWVHTLLQWWIDPETGSAISERSGVLRWFVRHQDELIWSDSKAELQARFPDIPAKSLTFIPGRLEDNPALMQADPDYRANLLALPRYERERLLGGNWNARPSAGKIFNRAWFEIVEAAPAQAKRIRYWDKAGTEGGGKRTAGVRMARHSESGLFYIEDVIAGQWGAMQREQIIKQTAQTDGQDVEVWIEQEPGSGGKESAENTIRNLAGFNVRADLVRGSKIERAGPMSAQSEAGNVKLVSADWNKLFLDEAQAFDEKAQFKDRVDAATGAFNKLTLEASTTGLLDYYAELYRQKQDDKNNSTKEEN